MGVTGAGTDRDDDRLAAPGPAWAVAVTPLVVWFLQLNVLYLLVPPSCEVGHPWFHVVVTVVALAGVAGATARSVATWRTTDTGDGAGGATAVARLAGAVGALSGALAVVAVLGLGAAAVVGDPCG